MRISVFGLGYVGVVSAACLAGRGHRVVGVDVNPTKLEIIGRGASPIIEPGVDELIAEAVASGALTVTGDTAKAVAETDLSLICVGTPSRPNGNLDTSAVMKVCEQIGAALKDKTERHIVVIRSTVLPGTIHELVIPALERASGLTAGEEFEVADNPEFLRESTAVYDFNNPPKTVIGATSPAAADAVAGLYDGIDAPLFKTSIETAEMIKNVDNVWHATKVAFGNEVGSLCKAHGIDSHEVIDVFLQDTKLNISPYYLRPGFAFGGSCLPKDLRAMVYRAKQKDVRLPVIEAVMPSNSHQIERGVEMVLAKGAQKIAFLGFSFKAGTDDLRESPQVELIERLIGKGKELKLYDDNVSLARLTGANRDYILKVIPHVSSLMVDTIDEAIADAELIIIGNKSPDFADLAGKTKPGQEIFDLCFIPALREQGDRYDGINW